MSNLYAVNAVILQEAESAEAAISMVQAAIGEKVVDKDFEVGYAIKVVSGPKDSEPEYAFNCYAYLNKAPFETDP